MERRLDELAVQRSSLAKAIILLQNASDPEFQQQQRELIRKLPDKYHAHGVRRQVVYLPGGVDVTLHVTYYHRLKDQGRASRKPQRGLFPALMLLGVSNRLTPMVRQRMAKASALLGSFEEASEMLAEAGITVSVNTLRNVCGHIGQKLVQLTSSGSMQVAGNVKGRRIVVSLDGPADVHDRSRRGRDGNRAVSLASDGNHHTRRDLRGSRAGGGARYERDQCREPGRSGRTEWVFHVPVFSGRGEERLNARAGSAHEDPAPSREGVGLRRRRGLLARDRSARLPEPHGPVASWTDLTESTSESLTVAGPRRTFTGLPSAPPSTNCEKMGTGSLTPVQVLPGRERVRAADPAAMKGWSCRNAPNPRASRSVDSTTRVSTAWAACARSTRSGAGPGWTTTADCVC